MKSIISFLVVLSFAAVAIAQEESPSPSSEEKAPAASEEKASATVEETPAATIVATPKASAAAKESTAAAKKEASPAAAGKKTTAAAPAAAAKPTKNMGVRDMEDAWEAAVGKHDLATVEGYVAADFVGVSSKGKFVNRSQILSEFKGDKDTYKSAKNEKLNVQMFGPSTTVVTGRAREVGTGKDGKAFDRTFLFTDTWMMRGGKWQCVASQVMKVKG